MKRLKNFIRNIRNKIVLNSLKKYQCITFSQEGEDVLINRMLANKIGGMYVDIGAHHPFRFSNTFLFYLRDWNGINIDAMPGSMKLFNRYRKRDINIECGISNAEGSMRFYTFLEPALNTFDEKLAFSREKEGFHIKESIDVPVKRLETILKEYIKPGQEIDFFSIDTEGIEYKVLQSNDWEKYSPNIILCEVLKTDSIENMVETEIAKYLKEKGYRLYASIYNTSVFVKNNFMIS